MMSEEEKLHHTLMEEIHPPFLFLLLSTLSLGQAKVLSTLLFNHSSRPLKITTLKTYRYGNDSRVTFSKQT